MGDEVVSPVTTKLFTPSAKAALMASAPALEMVKFAEAWTTEKSIRIFFKIIPTSSIITDHHPTEKYANAK